MKEWEEAQICLDCVFVESFLAGILERIDFLNTSASALETVTSHDSFQVGARVIKQIVKVSVCPGIIEIQKRANLCLPLLLFLTQTRHKYC